MGLISYDGVNPFEGQADPLVSMSTSYDDTDGGWSRTDSYTFEGQFTGCAFKELIVRQEDLVKSFSEDFKKLEIAGFDLTTKSNLVTKVPNISFGESDYLGAVPYSVTVDCTELSQEAVKNPTDSVAFTENEDDTLSISHSVSCVGIDQGSCNGLQNAIDWVNSRLNISSRKPGLIPGYTLGNMELESINENIDRMGYSYGIQRNFKVDKNNTNTPALRFTTQVCTDEDAVKTSIRGSVEGRDKYTQAEVDSTYQNFSQGYPYEFDSYSVDYNYRMD